MTAASMLNHITLLHDKERGMAYLKAIQQSVHPGDRVLDLGSGSGLMGIFAAICGAGHVTCFERDPILVSMIEEHAQTLGLADKISVVAGNSVEDLAEKADGFDLLLNDPFGFFGLSDELDIMRACRDRFLSDPTRIMPRHMCLMLSPAHVPDLGRWLRPDVHYREFVPISLMGQLASRDVLTAQLQPNHIVTKPVEVASINLTEMSTGRLQCTADFTFEADAEFDFLAGWYEADLAPGVSLASGPWCRRPMGKCRLFPCGDVLSAAAGSTLNVALDCNSRLGFWQIEQVATAPVSRTSLESHPKWSRLGITEHHKPFRDAAFDVWDGLPPSSALLQKEVLDILEQTRKSFDGSFQ